MPSELTIATFNANNLFTRFKFRGKRVKNPPGAQQKYRYVPYTPQELATAVEDGFIIDREMFEKTMAPTRPLTAEAIRAVNADIIALQEIEDLDSLKLFNGRYLNGKYAYQYVIDGNDPRLIDVGLLSRYPVDILRTHQFRRKGKGKVFSRDCLEAHVRVGDVSIPLFINHFKSMMEGRAKTRLRRLDQCEAVLAILRERFGPDFGDADFVVLGDLNDYFDGPLPQESGIAPLLQSAHLVDVVARQLPAADRWTHFYDRKNECRQLDYILLSRRLADRNAGAIPAIVRGGMPLAVNRPGQPPRVTKFFKTIAQSQPKQGLRASDHCPVAITLTV